MAKINLTISDNVMIEMEEMKRHLGVGSLVEVIWTSVSLTRWLDKEKQQGHEIIVRDNKNKEDKILTSFR